MSDEFECSRKWHFGLKGLIRKSVVAAGRGSDTEGGNNEENAGVEAHTNDGICRLIDGMLSACFFFLFLFLFFLFFFSVSSSKTSLEIQQAGSFFSWRVC